MVMGGSTRIAIVSSGAIDVSSDCSIFTDLTTGSRQLFSLSQTWYLWGKHPAIGCTRICSFSAPFNPLLSSFCVSFAKNRAPLFWNCPFLSQFDVFHCKLIPEICLFRSLWKAEKEVRWGSGCGKGGEARNHVSLSFSGYLSGRILLLALIDPVPQTNSPKDLWGKI